MTDIIFTLIESTEAHREWDWDNALDYYEDHSDLVERAVVQYDGVAKLYSHTTDDLDQMVEDRRKERAAERRREQAEENRQRYPY